MSAQQLLTLYKNILTAASCHVDENNGHVSLVVEGQQTPVMVQDKRLILPLHEAMRNYNAATQQAFHPLCESTVRGESPVLKKLHTLIAFRLHAVLSQLLISLLDVAVDKTTHQRLTPKQMPLIQILHDVDGKTKDALKDVIKGTDPMGTNRIISVYLHKRPNLDKPYRRACMVSFPVLNELAKPELDVFGRTMRKKDKASLTALLLYILGDCDKPQHYSVGTNADFAPFFDCLTRAFIKVQRDLNAMVKLYQDFIPNAASYISDLDWEGELSNTHYLRGLLPVLAGNEGDNDIAIANNNATVSNTPQTAPMVNTSQTMPITVNPGVQPMFANTSANAPNVSLGATGPAAVTSGSSSAAADEVATWSGLVSKNAMANVMTPQFAARGVPMNVPVFNPANGVMPNMVPGMMPGMVMPGMMMAGNGMMMAPNQMQFNPNSLPHGVMNTSHLLAQQQQAQQAQFAMGMQQQQQWGGAPMAFMGQPQFNANMPTWLNQQPQPQFNMGMQQPQFNPAPMVNNRGIV